MLTMCSTLESCLVPTATQTTGWFEQLEQVGAKVKITIKATVKMGPQTKKLHVSWLLTQREEFNRELKARFCKLESSHQDPDPEKWWNQTKIILQETAVDVAVFSYRKNRDWFDEKDSEIQKLLELQHTCHKRLLPCPDNQACKAAYRTVRWLRKSIFMLTLETLQPSVNPYVLSMAHHNIYRLLYAHLMALPC